LDEGKDIYNDNDDEEEYYDNGKLIELNKLNLNIINIKCN
jgi:hypothetical protein